MKNELHQATENVGSLIGMKFSPLWIKAKVALLFESISTLFLLPPKPPGSNFDSFITKNSPVPLAGMYFVLFTIMYHNCVFINKCLQLLPHFIKIWLPQILGIFTALPGNWWFKQSHQTWTSLHSLLFSGALYHLPECQISNHHASSLPPHHPVSNPLVLVEQHLVML